MATRSFSAHIQFLFIEQIALRAMAFCKRQGNGFLDSHSFARNDMLFDAFSIKLGAEAIETLCHFD